MLLYHGTSVRLLKKILKSGIAARGQAKGNWDHVPSAPDRVYLTEGYPIYFGCNASNDHRNDVAVIEVDTEKLNMKLMRPDEDVLAQYFIDKHPKMTLKALTLWYREHINEFASQWQDSLKGMGTCSYRGTIKPAAITRYSIVSLRNPVALMGIDPAISIINWQFCSRKYKALTAWSVGREFDEGDLFDLTGFVDQEARDSVLDEEPKPRVTIL